MIKEYVTLKTYSSDFKSYKQSIKLQNKLPLIKDDLWIHAKTKYVSDTAYC